jgi:hypothetical protein
MTASALDLMFVWMVVIRIVGVLLYYDFVSIETRLVSLLLPVDRAHVWFV